MAAEGQLGSVAIVSPFDVWSAGMESILLTIGSPVVGRWTDPDHALDSGDLSRADLLILARRLIDRPGQSNPFRPLNGAYSGKIIVVLEPEDEFSAKEFIAMEVEGLMLSSASVAEVRDCVTSVEHGRRWIDPGIRALLGHAEPPPPDYHELSSRELEVARLAAAGLSNKRIARALHVSDGTVKMHMHLILAKLRLGGRVDLVRSFGEIAAASAEGQRERSLHLVRTDQRSKLAT